MFSKEKIISAYSMEKCNSCSFERKRDFKEGDHLFANVSTCESCQGKIRIEKIFGEEIE